MREGKLPRLGGYISGGVLILFGIGVIVLGIWGFTFMREDIERGTNHVRRASDPRGRRASALGR